MKQINRWELPLKDEGQLEEAISAYHQALSLNPKNRRQLT